MDRIAKALAAHDEAYAEIAHALFGDGADELIEKMSPGQSDLAVRAAKKQKSEKTQAKIAFGTNVVGIAAGTAGLASASRDDRLALPEAGKISNAIHAGGTKLNRAVEGTKRGKKLVALAQKPGNAAKLGAGALGLQAGNLAGDAIANRVLSRASKDKPDLKVKKVTQGKKSQVKKTDLIAKRMDDVEQLDVTWSGDISKIDSDKRQVFGMASVTEVNGEPVVDRQGDYISIEEVEKSAYEYVQKSRKGGDMHRRTKGAFGEDQAHHVSDMIESFVITDEKIAKMGLPEDTPRGWWVGFQVHDDSTWNLVKSGQRSGFSIHGKGSRVSKVL